jgi:hypothetical protein
VDAVTAYFARRSADPHVVADLTADTFVVQANAKFHQLGDRVVVVPVRPGCPSISSLPKPAVSGDHGQSRAMSGSLDLGPSTPATHDGTGTATRLP